MAHRKKFGLGLESKMADSAQASFLAQDSENGHHREGFLRDIRLVQTRWTKGEYQLDGQAREVALAKYRHDLLSKIIQAKREKAGLSEIRKALGGDKEKCIQHTIDFYETNAATYKETSAYAAAMALKTEIIDEIKNAKAAKNLEAQAIAVDNVAAGQSDYNLIFEDMIAAPWRAELREQLGREEKAILSRLQAPKLDPKDVKLKAAELAGLIVKLESTPSTADTMADRLALSRQIDELQTELDFGTQKPEQIAKAHKQLEQVRAELKATPAIQNTVAQLEALKEKVDAELTQRIDKAEELGVDLLDANNYAPRNRPLEAEFKTTSGILDMLDRAQDEKGSKTKKTAIQIQEEAQTRLQAEQRNQSALRHMNALAGAEKMDGALSIGSFLKYGLATSLFDFAEAEKQKAAQEKAQAALVKAEANLKLQSDLAEEARLKVEKAQNQHEAQLAATKADDMARVALQRVELAKAALANLGGAVTEAPRVKQDPTNILGW
jgi:hypothetical protein